MSCLKFAALLSAVVGLGIGRAAGAVPVVFNTSSSVWLEQKVVAEGSSPRFYFGGATAIEGDTAMIGASTKNKVFVFKRENNVWVQTQVLTAEDYPSFSQFGTAISLDGKTALIGANFATVNGNKNQGAAYVFTESDGVWKRTAKLVASDGAAYDNLGFDVALDGTRALVTKYGPTGQWPGRVYVFTESDGTWQQTDELSAPRLSTFDGFGYSVALDGNTLFVGAQLADTDGTNNSAGSVYVYRESNGKWKRVQKLTAADREPGDYFGFSISLSGATALIGAPHNANYGGGKQPGKVYVFEKVGDAWEQTQEFSADDGEPDDQFGDAVTLHGTQALIGARGATIDHYPYPGAGYLFKESNGVWKQAQKFSASDGQPGNYYGAKGAIALGDTTVLLGALAYNGFQGAAYFYARSNINLAVSAPAKVGLNDSYVSQVIVTNESSAASPAVAATVGVPVAATYISAQASQGDCAESAGALSCNIGQIEGNAGTATVNVKLQPVGERGEVIRNTATLLSIPPLTASTATVINRLPNARDGKLTTFVNRSANGTLEASDPDQDALTFSIVSPAGHGTVVVDNSASGAYTYTPQDNFVGADSFTFNASDDEAPSNTATVVVVVNNRAPVASGGQATTEEGAPVSGTLDASDPDGDPLTYRISSLPSRGVVTVDSASGDYTYTPDADFSGTDSFGFEANDGHADSGEATITVTVTAAPAPTPPPPDNGGGGGLGWPLLALLLAFALAVAAGRRCGRGPSTKAGAFHGQERVLAMNRRVLNILGALFLAAIVAGFSTPRTAFASPVKPNRASALRSGLANDGLVAARRSGEPSRLVTMAPQSSLDLLAHATKMGAHAPNSKIKLVVALKLRNLSGLESFLQAVQNPRSPLYHQWLTPRKFTARYGPSEADVARVIAFLKAHDIKVTKVSSNRLLIHTAATTNAFEHAFGIRINDYRLNGRSFYSTTDSPKLPREIAPLVVNVLGLNHGVRMRPMSRVSALHAAGTAPREAPPPATAYFSPKQIATAYDWPDITDTDNGAGITIAILTALTPNAATNPNYHDFWAAYGLPDHDITVVPVGSGNNPGGAGETALDVEWSGAMAPGASLKLYVAGNAGFDTFTEMYNKFVTDGEAQVMTTSWGLAEAGNPDIDVANEQIFMEAAAQGVSMFAAAGDHAASDCADYCPPGPNNADFPSSSNYITAANGTELTISDVNGAYGNEHAWKNTGGAVSQLFDKPDWQRGPGVPGDVAMRMNSDIAMNAGPLHPYVVYMNGVSGTTFYGVAGTSAVAPILAAMFAIGVSHQPDRVSLGQSNKLIYDAVNANDTNYATDFHDVTAGCNGELPDGSPSCAGANWDHPTGWGSPKASSLLSHLGIQGPSGVLTGTVTDAANGMPIADAKVIVNPGNYMRSTESDGGYSLRLPVGDYTVEVADFGYEPANASADIGDGDTVTRDLTLHLAPTAMLSGHVTDASGHGYGLYAEVKIEASPFGQVADVWTDPGTGSYQVELPKGAEYKLNVASALNGYLPDDATVSLDGDRTQNFGLQVAQACTAPGYRFRGLNEDFNGAWPPAGWTVTDDYSNFWTGPSPIVWNTMDYWQEGNYTGGTGSAATVDSGNASTLFSYYGEFDSSLVTPPIPVTSLPAGAMLRYKANYVNKSADALDLDISTDGGATWQTISHWDSNTPSHGTLHGLPGVTVNLDMASRLPASGTVQLRWRYYNLTNSFAWDWYAQIDDVALGACERIPGGLVFGRVTDGNTGDGVLHAVVNNGSGGSVLTVVNPADPDFPAGSYILFVPGGTRDLTASYPDYSPSEATIAVADNAVLRQDFTLEAGRLTVSPDHIAAQVMLNNRKTRTLEVKNTGSAPVNFKVLAINAPSPATGVGAAQVPALEVPGHYTPASPVWARTHGQAPSSQARPSRVAPRAAPWKNITDLPAVLMDDAAVTDPTTGIVYVIAGIDGIRYLDTVYAYDPDTQAWDQVANAPSVLGAPVAGFINGKIYVANGWNSQSRPSPELDIYHVADDVWTTGTDNPVPAAGGSAAAVLNGELYVIGGCNDAICSAPLAAVQVYDPAQNSWQSLANYPHPVTFASCGNIDNKLYCAGGTGKPGVFYKDGYMYDPGNPAAGWTPIADIPVRGDVGLWGSGYVASHGELLVSGGVTANGGIITNKGFSYDPLSGVWTPLPNANDALYRGGSTCGFYRVGGSSGGVTPVTKAEMLPGYGTCGSEPVIPYLTVTPASGTVAPGASTQLTLIYDGSGQEEFTSSRAHLEVVGNVPYSEPIVSLITNWEPQPVNLVLTGTSSPQGIHKGGSLAYTLTVQNRKADNHGAATQVTLAYAVPDGARFQAASGDASCTAAPSGGSAPAPTTGGSSATTVICNFGTIALDASKTEILAIKADAAGHLDSHFKVGAREPDSDTSNNLLELGNFVPGWADLAVSAPTSINLVEGASGAIQLKVANSGPDGATDVHISVTQGGLLSISSASSPEGGCTINRGSGGGIDCGLKNIPANGEATVTLNVFSTYTGFSAMGVLVTTSSEDADTKNNGAQIKVTVRAPSPSANDSSGGGALDWLALAALLGLVAIVTMRGSRGRV